MDCYNNFNSFDFLIISLTYRSLVKWICKLKFPCYMLLQNHFGVFVLFVCRCRNSLKRNHPHPWVGRPSVSFQFFPEYGGIPQLLELIKGSQPFFLNAVLCDLLQPLHTHFIDFHPDPRGFFGHMNRWLPFPGPVILIPVRMHRVIFLQRLLFVHVPNNLIGGFVFVHRGECFPDI